MKQVLIIEPDLQLGAVLTDLFEIWGFEVNLQHILSVGLHELDRRSVDLVLCNSHFPDLANEKLFDNLTEARKRSCAPWILLTTARTNIDDIGVLPPRCHWLSMPFSSENLSDLIAELSKTEGRGVHSNATSGSIASHCQAKHLYASAS